MKKKIPVTNILARRDLIETMMLGGRHQSALAPRYPTPIRFRIPTRILNRTTLVVVATTTIDLVAQVITVVTNPKNVTAATVIAPLPTATPTPTPTLPLILPNPSKITKTVMRTLGATRPRPPAPMLRLAPHCPLSHLMANLWTLERMAEPSCQVKALLWHPMFRTESESRVVVKSA